MTNRDKIGRFPAKTQEEYLFLFKLKHGNRYDYSKFIYTGAHGIIIVICKEHGEFTLKAYSHKDGRGCSDCYYNGAPRTNKELDLYLINNNFTVKRLGDFKSKKNVLNFECLTCYHIWPGKFINIKKAHEHSGVPCPKCYEQKIIKDHEERRAKMTIEIDNALINRNIKRLSPFYESTSDMDWQCLICDYKWTVPSAQVVIRKNGSGSGCKKCAHWCSNAEIDEYLINHKIKIKRLDDYIKNDIKINWQCLRCDYIWPSKPLYIKQKFGCPNCSSGKSEREIREFLKENNIKVQEFRVKLPISKNEAIPDFYIPSMNLIIEYNGDQHYRPVKFGKKSQEKINEAFKYQQIRDQQMRDYCSENWIELWEIDGRKYVNDKLMNLLHDYFEIDKPVYLIK